jgi:hypothetical protein
MYYLANFAQESSGGKVYRAGRWWTPNKPVPSNRAGKKKMVLASKRVDGETKYKVVHYGAEGYSDYTKHKDPARRKRFMQRHKAIKLKSGEPAHKNKFQAAYWSTNSRGGTW